MRIALLSDVHGDPLARDAVLAAMQAQGGVDGSAVLGDRPALGDTPAPALARFARLPTARLVRGTTDRDVTPAEQPEPAAEAVRDDPRG